MQPEPAEEVELDHLPGASNEAMVAADLVEPKVRYKSSISTGQPVLPRAFGATGHALRPFSNVRIRQADGVFTVSADATHVIRWGVRSGLGPRGQVNIAGVSDPAIDADNYTRVADDLTPGLGNVEALDGNIYQLNNVPPRTQFWSRALCAAHERFHANDYAQFGELDLIGAQAQLIGAEVSTKNDVLDLLQAVWTDAKQTIDNDVSSLASEQRAYDAGAPAYQELADAIRARGDAGGYRARRHHT